MIKMDILSMSIQLNLFGYVIWYIHRTYVSSVFISLFEDSWHWFPQRPHQFPFLLAVYLLLPPPKTHP